MIGVRARGHAAHGGRQSSGCGCQRQHRGGCGKFHHADGLRAHQPRRHQAEEKSKPTREAVRNGQRKRLFFEGLGHKNASFARKLMRRR